MSVCVISSEQQANDLELISSVINSRQSHRGFIRPKSQNKPNKEISCSQMNWCVLKPRRRHWTGEGVKKVLVRKMVSLVTKKPLTLIGHVFKNKASGGVISVSEETGRCRNGLEEERSRVPPHGPGSVVVRARDTGFVYYWSYRVCTGQVNSPKDDALHSLKAKLAWTQCRQPRQDWQGVIRAEPRYQLLAPHGPASVFKQLGVRQL